MERWTMSKYNVGELTTLELFDLLRQIIEELFLRFIQMSK